jgi:hypothetical protein
MSVGVTKDYKMYMWVSVLKIGHIFVFPFFFVLCDSCSRGKWRKKPPVLRRVYQDIHFANNIFQIRCTGRTRSRSAGSEACRPEVSTHQLYTRPRLGPQQQCQTTMRPVPLARPLMLVGRTASRAWSVMTSRASWLSPAPASRRRKSLAACPAPVAKIRPSPLSLSIMEMCLATRWTTSTLRR